MAAPEPYRTDEEYSDKDMDVNDFFDDDFLEGKDIIYFLYSALTVPGMGRFITKLRKKMGMTGQARIPGNLKGNQTVISNLITQNDNGKALAIQAAKEFIQELKKSANKSLDPQKFYNRYIKVGALEDFFNFVGESFAGKRQTSDIDQLASEVYIEGMFDDGDVDMSSSSSGKPDPGFQTPGRRRQRTGLTPQGSPPDDMSLDEDWSPMSSEGRQGRNPGYNPDLAGMPEDGDVTRFLDSPSQSRTPIGQGSGKALGKLCPACSSGLCDTHIQLRF